MAGALPAWFGWAYACFSSGKSQLRFFIFAVSLLYHYVYIGVRRRKGDALPFGLGRQTGQTTSDFQLLCGTNRDLLPRIARGEFREDLFARINFWTFRLPGLHERPEDIAPNLEFELQQASKVLQVNVTTNREARDTFLHFASRWTWTGNFRAFNASVTRMATLAPGGRITENIARGEVGRLREVGIGSGSSNGGSELLCQVLGAERATRLDRFDRVQLQDVLAVCRDARSLSAAGRELFANSRSERRSVNDADRLRKYLARFGVDFGDVKGREGSLL